MRNLRKLLSVLLVVAMMVTTMIPAFALTTDASAAQICSDLEILKGTSDEGVTDAYLGTESQRYQSATILLRLMGVYEDALAFDSTDNFADATDLEWTEGRPLLAFLKANSEYGFQGSTSGNFFPNNVISAQEFDKVLLTALGYEQGTDFTWDETTTFAKFVGLKALDGKGNLTNNDLAEAIVEALSTDVKDGDGYTLAQKLADEGVIDPAIAEEYGLIAPAAQIAELAAPEDIVVTAGEEVVLPETVSATWDNDETTDEVVTWDTSDVDFAVAGEYEITGTVDGTDLTVTQKVTVNAMDYTATAVVKHANKIDVTFNQPVDSTKATLTLKRGLVTLPATVSYSEDKKVATITSVNPFATDTYTVVVDGLGMKDNTIDVVATQAAPDKFVISGDTLPIVASASFGFKAYDQYGDEIAVAPNSVQWFIAPGTATNVSTATVAAINTSGLKVDDAVTVIAIQGAVQATHTFKITTAPALATFTMGAITNDKADLGDRSKLNDIDGQRVGTMAFTAADQYGNAIEDYATLNSAVQFVYSSTKVTLGWVIGDSGKGKIQVTVKPDAALTANEPVTVTALTAGKIYGSTQFTVSAAPHIVSATIAAPSGVIAVSDANADFEVSALDQYGNAMSADDIVAAYAAHKIQVFTASTSVSFVGTADIVKNDAGKAVVRLNTLGGAAGNITVTIVTNGASTSSAALAVQPARFAQTIQFVEGTTKFVAGATSTLTYKLLDQYGAEYKGAATVVFDNAKVSGDDDAFVVGAINGDRKVDVTAAAGKKGAYNLTAKITASGMTLNSVATNLVSVDASAETISYSINSIPTLYKDGANNGAYAVGISVTATDAAGNPVAIPANTIASIVSSDSAYVGVDSVNDKVYGNNAGLAADTSVVVTVTLNTIHGTKVISKVVTVSKDSLIAQSIVAKDADGNVKNYFELTAGTYNLLTASAMKFVVTDQFGGTSLSTMNDMQIVVASASGTTVLKGLVGSSYTFVKDQTYILTGITNNGKIVEVTVKGV